jgi:Cupredoxin-like domain
VRTSISAFLALSLLAAAPARAAPAEITLTLNQHRFAPAVFAVPAGQPVHITLINQDPASEEFDSHDLRVEEVVAPMGKISFNIGPLRPGQYSFMGEFHAATAQGRVVVVNGGH